jgi:F420-non-reducing hydrogenase iron-sulfur subunit
MEKYKPKVVCFSCKFGWGYLTDSATLCAQTKNFIPVTCTSKVGASHVLEAFRHGADGVLLLGCPEGKCHFQDGNFRAAKRMYLLQQVIQAFGLEPERIGIRLDCDPAGSDIPQYVHEMETNLTKLGPVRLL